jgi:Rrf2 family protein
VKFSMKTDYGVRALTDLANHYGEGLITTASIASREGIPEPFLDQLMILMRKAGLVRSVRGPQGGHQLAKDPGEITLADVVLALEGSLTPIECLEHAEGCAKGPRCAQRAVWQEVQSTVEGILRRVTLRELAERERRAANALMYHI